MMVVLNSGCVCLAFGEQFKCANAYTDAAYDPAAGAPKYTAYQISSTKKTAGGIAVDGSGFETAAILALIDRKTAEVETCLRGKRPALRIRRCGFTVKIATDWGYAVSGGIVPHALATPEQAAAQQVFPCQVGPSNLCYGINQFPSTIVVPPDLAAYKHELIHAVLHLRHNPAVSDANLDPAFLTCQ